MLRKPGRAVALAVGGAEESLLSRPCTLNLVLKKRQGFVRIALQTGLMALFAFKEHIKVSRNLHRLQLFSVLILLTLLHL